MQSFSVAIGSMPAVFLFLSSHITDLMSWCNFSILVSVILSFCSPVWATALLCLCAWDVPFLHLIVVLYRYLYNIIVVPSTRCTVPTSHHLSPQSHDAAHANAIIYHRVDRRDCDQNCIFSHWFWVGQDRVCRKYRAKKSGDIGSISLIQECPKNSLLLKCTILP